MDLVGEYEIKRKEVLDLRKNWYETHKRYLDMKPLSADHIPDTLTIHPFYVNVSEASGMILKAMKNLAPRPDIIEEIRNTLRSDQFLLNELPKAIR